MRLICVSLPEYFKVHIDLMVSNTSYTYHSYFISGVMDVADRSAFQEYALVQVDVLAKVSVFSCMC